jgi:hypothetical protein
MIMAESSAVLIRQARMVVAPHARRLPELRRCAAGSGLRRDPWFAGQRWLTQVAFDPSA